MRWGVITDEYTVPEILYPASYSLANECTNEPICYVNFQNSLNIPTILEANTKYALVANTKSDMVNGVWLQKDENCNVNDFYIDNVFFGPIGLFTGSDTKSIS